MLSKNPNITMDIVQENEDIPWEYTLIENPNITMNIILDNINFFEDIIQYCLEKSKRLYGYYM